MKLRRALLVGVSASVAMLATARTANAAVIPIGVVDFGPGSTLTTFTGIVGGIEVNNLTIEGILYQYSLGNGHLIIDTLDGPGNTNNITLPDVLSVGNPTGILTLTLPSLVDRFGYGFAIPLLVTVPNATTISLFNGATPVGSLSYTGVPDPQFAGGFAGIFSDLPFNRVLITFNPTAAAFALDNIRTQAFVTQIPAIPEPATLLLLGTGLAALARRRRRFDRSNRGS